MGSEGLVTGFPGTWIDFGLFLGAGSIEPGWILGLDSLGPGWILGPGPWDLDGFWAWGPWGLDGFWFKCDFEFQCIKDCKLQAATVFRVQLESTVCLYLFKLCCSFAIGTISRNDCPTVSQYWHQRISEVSTACFCLFSWV